MALFDCKIRLYEAINVNVFNVLITSLQYKSDAELIVSTTRKFLEGLRMSELNGNRNSSSEIEIVDGAASEKTLGALLTAERV